MYSACVPILRISLKAVKHARYGFCVLVLSCVYAHVCICNGDKSVQQVSCMGCIHEPQADKQKPFNRFGINLVCATACLG